VKTKLLALSLVLTLVGCSSTKLPNIDPGPVTAINAQKLSTNFKRKGVKLEWECAWGTSVLGAACIKGDIKAIEVTAYTTSNGNSETNRETAFKVAEMKAKAKLRHFIAEDVYSSTVKNVMAKNVEKASDRIKNRIKSDSDEEVSMSDEDSSKETNFAVRENSNDTVRTVTESIRTQASGILKGVHVSDSSIVDRQTVAVTIRWDKDSESISNYLGKKFR